MVREWVGTLDGLVNASIRAQVSGYILKQNYTEGQPIKKGDLLYELDDRTFKAALDHAMATAKERSEDLVALDEALSALSEFDERKGRVVEMRFFGGLSEKEIAEALAVSQETVGRDWRLSAGRRSA